MNEGAILGAYRPLQNMVRKHCFMHVRWFEHQFRNGSFQLAHSQVWNR
jgi:hypothetical protein